MNHSEDIKELATALSKAQSQMGAAVKDSPNQYKSKYADLTAVWQACREPLSNNGLCITQALDFIGDKQVLVTTMFHTSGQWIKSSIAMPNCPKPQDIGSAITYFRRYCLASICGIYQDDDDGEIAQRGTEIPDEIPAPTNHNIPIFISDKQRLELEYLTNKVPEAKKWISERLSIVNMHEMQAKDFDHIVHQIRRKLKKKEETVNV
jgi:hypothetical protein